MNHQEILNNMEKHQAIIAQNKRSLMSVDLKKNSKEYINACNNIYNNYKEVLKYRKMLAVKKDNFFQKIIKIGEKK
jgi:hypothetical protein